MPDLSWSQYIRLVIGGAGLMSKHAESVPALRALLNDAMDLWQEVVPPGHPAEPTVTPAEVAEKLRTSLTEAEQEQFDRASRQSDI